MDPAEPPEENDKLESTSSSSSLSSEGFGSSLVFLRTLTDPESWERLNSAEFTSLTFYFLMEERSPMFEII